MSNINLNGVRVDDQTGRVSFSGVQSGIDTEGAVNNIITARRIPIDRIETEIDRNRQIIAGTSDWRTLMTNLKSKAQVLYGEISLDNRNDVFESKQAFANTTRADGATPSQAGAMIGVTLSNDAELGVQEFEILQRATQHEIAMATSEDIGTPLGLTGQFKFATFDADADPNGLNGPINGAEWDPFIEISVVATDGLAEIRDKINLANQGPNASGVTAQLVTTGVDQGYLVLRGETAGETIDWVRAPTSATSPDVVLARLNFLSVNPGPPPFTDFTNVTVEPGKAQIALTDLLDAEQGVFSREFLNPTDIAATPSNQVRIQIDDLQTGLFQVTGPVNVGPGPVRPVDILAAFNTAGNFLGPGFDAGDVSGISDGVAGNGTNPGFNDLAATVPPAGTAWVRMNGGAQMAFIELVENEDGTQRLHAFMSNSNNYYDPNRRPIELDFQDIGPGTGGAAALAEGLGMRPDPVIVERSTNQIDDLFKGVTLDLLKAEPGTTIELDIQRDLNTVKTAINDFVEAYNEVVRFGNLQRQTDPLTGEPVEEASLFRTSILGQTESLFELLGAQPAAGIKGVNTTLPPADQIVGLDFRTLAQIGIEIISLDQSEANPLERKTLTIDDATLDNALLTEFEAVEQLFSTTFTTDQANVVVQSFNGSTDFTNGGGIRLNFDPEDATEFDKAPGDPPVTYSLIDAFGNVTQADVGTVEITATGQIIFNDDGPANGLRAFFTGLLPGEPGFNPPGAPPYTFVDISMTKGIGNNFYYGLDRLVDPDVGSLSSEIDAREADNELKSSRIDEQLERLERERIRLTEQFNRMEAALAQLESLKQQVAAAFGQTNSE